MIFKRIALIPNSQKDSELRYTKVIAEYFSEKKTIVYIDEQHKNIIKNIIKDKDSEYIKYIGYGDIFDVSDLVLVLGGDGTIIRAAEKAAVKKIPIIGVNLGTVGFMSEIEVDEISLLENLYRGDFNIENRMMIEAAVESINGEIKFAKSVLNDAVISKGNISRLIEISLSCDNTRAAKYRADGVIIATPTGSTAYSMSAGGPIIDPTIECFCVTPICPHTLVNRPLIFSTDSVLKIHNTNNSDREVYLNLDGQINIKLDENDTVKITKSKFFTKLIRIKSNGFFNAVREKIGE